MAKSSFKNLVRFYSGVVGNFISDGAFVNKKNISAIGIKPLYDKIVTKSHIKKVVCISRMPVELQTNFSMYIHKAINASHPNCKAIIVTDNFKSELHRNYRSKEFKSSMSRAEADYQKYKAIIDSMTDSQRTQGMEVELGAFSKVDVTQSQLDILKNIYDSYKYSYETITKKGVLLDTYLFVELIAPNVNELRMAYETLCDVLLGLGCSYIPVRGSTFKYLKYMSPTSYFNRVKGDPKFKEVLMSNRNLAYTLPYESHGFIGDGSGTLMGVDIGANSPFILNFFKTSDRQVVMFVCPSGKGKTFSAMYTALFLLDDNVHCSVIDVKGDEWIKLAQFTDYRLLDFSSSGGYYVNTLRIDDLVELLGNDVNAETALSLYTSSVEATTELLCMISGYTEEHKDYNAASMIIKNGVSKYIMMNGVNKNNFRSFVNSASLNYADLVSSFSLLKEVDNMKAYIDIINNIINTCETYFRESSMFQGVEVSLRDIIDTPLIIYSLGKNKNPNSSGIDSSISSFMISFLDMKKIYYRKSFKLGTACFYEELQRKREFAKLVKFIVAIVTGARSSNVTVFLLCNSPSTLLDKDIAPIRSNVSTYILGPYNDESDLEVLNSLGLGDTVPKVKMLADEPKMYNHSFVCKFDTGDVSDTCIFKAVATAEIAKAFGTRDAIGM